MIVAVSGWRGFTDWRYVWNELDELKGRYGSFELRVGCSRKGVDIHVREWHEQSIVWAPGHLNQVTGFTVYYAAWVTYGRHVAGPIRNRNMLNGTLNGNVQADLLLAIPEPLTRAKIPGSGTWGCIIEAQAMGIEVSIKSHARLNSTCTSILKKNLPHHDNVAGS